MRTLAVVHPTSLIAKELRERLEARPALCRELRLLSAEEEEIGTLTESVGAAAFVGRIEPESFDGVDLAFFCGTIEHDRETLARLARSHPAIPAILLSRGAGPEDGLPAVAGVRDAARLGVERLVSPHPAAVAAALLLDPLAPLAPRRAVATVIQPVSSEGEPGMDELFEQTRGILAFAGKPKGMLFPAQIAFNVVPAAAETAGVAELARAALGADYPLAIEVLQGGIFHAVSVSLYVELGESPAPAELRKRIARSAAVTAVRHPERLGPVAAAGEETLQLGAVRAAGGAGAYWIWATMDNLVRGGAANAVALAESLLAPGAAPT